jgi:hypothetical protein
MLRQALDGFGEDGAGDQDGGLWHGQSVTL